MPVTAILGYARVSTTGLSKNMPNVQLWQDIKNITLWNILQGNGFADNISMVNQLLFGRISTLEFMSRQAKV